MYSVLEKFETSNEERKTEVIQLETPEEEPKTRPPATTVSGRENQMISLAVQLAEKQLKDGTASAMVITHFLKLGTTRAELERIKLERENELLKARTDALASAEEIKTLYAEAIEAMRSYSPSREDDIID